MFVKPVRNNSCVQLSVDNFPMDLLRMRDLEKGGLVLYILIALYLFAAMTLLIQAYLVGAIRTLADQLKIVSYSARNTMIIPAILLPEFFCSLISVFVEKGNIASATIIGSCAANSLLTLGVVGLLLSRPVKLSWYPLWRDNIFYSVIVTVLLWTTYDLKLNRQECIFMFGIYFLYLLIINFNHQVERGVRRIVIMYRTGDDEIEADQEIEKLSSLGSGKPFAHVGGMHNDLGRNVSTKVAADSGDKTCSCCEDTDLKESSFMDTDKTIREDSFELSGDADDPVIDIESTTECICEENQDYHIDTDVSATLINQTDAKLCDKEDTSLIVNKHGYFSSGHYSEGTQLDITDGYGSCGSSIFVGDSKETSDKVVAFLPKSNISKYVQHTQNFQPHNYPLGMYYITIDMNHYLNGPSSPFNIPNKWYMKLFWIISLPAILCFYMTIPDCRKPKWKKWFPLTILISLLWVAALTYVLLWMSVEIGYVWKIPDSVLGFMFLATGLSFSKIVTTYFQSKAGYGYKAVYSIYGSNVFNLTVNLGLVWFIASIFHNPYILYDGSIVYANLCQLIIVLTPLLLQFTRWRLNKVLAVMFLILYGCFTTIVVLMEYGIIGKFHPRICAN